MIVAALATTPVKGLRLLARNAVQLDERGVADNRRFYLIDARDRMVNGKQLGQLQTVVPDYDHEARTLTVRFPDGREVGGAVASGAAVRARFFSHEVEGRLVMGPWSDALSEWAGRPLRLVEATDARIGVDRGRAGAVSLVSRASLADLAGRLRQPDIDGRRFRMLVEVDGATAYEEDGWVGRPVRVGEAVIRPRGHVGRCLVTSRDPETGEIDLPTLEALGAYRTAGETTEPLSMGVYGEVLTPGVVRVGDDVLAL